MLPVDVQTNYDISSVHAQWFSHQKIDQIIVMSFNDITVIAHAIGGGKYISRANLSFGAVVWVSGTERLGLLLSHHPSTLAISVPLMEQSISWKNCLPCLFMCKHPDFLGTL